MKLLDRLLLPENLYFAWMKAKRFFFTPDGYIDRGEIAEFELNLEANLNAIRKNFIKGRYRTEGLRPLPRPKKAIGAKFVDRQYFHVSVRDQVAWIAVVNAIGPELDKEMASWSYGNRLYRPAWYEDEESQSKLEIGPYRHASGHTYRKFQHSWPLFRRQISLTARAMVSGRKPKSEELDEAESRALSAAETEKLRYLTKDYWRHVPNRKGNYLHFASIDLKQFFPKLNTKKLLTRITEAISDKDERIPTLLDDMLNFRVFDTGIPLGLTCNVEPGFPKTIMTGLPTGLFVAGFLSNVAMRKVDYLVENELNQHKEIAHFRYVDDHTILSYDFDKLCEWIRWYESLLKSEGVGPEVNSEKFDPESLGDWLEKLPDNSHKHSDEKDKESRVKAFYETRIDGKSPTKLMTKTLNQVSAIAAEDINILDDIDLTERLRMLEWLLETEISEREIRPDTKAAFVAGQVAQLAPILIQEENDLTYKLRDFAAQRAESSKISDLAEKEKNDSNKNLKTLEHDIEVLSSKQCDSERQFHRRCFKLLMQALEEFPGKPRLIFRILQFCRNTGYEGLSEIGENIKKLRRDNKLNWANYYSGLTLQLLGQNAVICAKLLNRSGTLRSDQKVAQRHLTDIGNRRFEAFGVEAESEAWFHLVAKREFAVSLLFAARMLEGREGLRELASRLSIIAKQLTRLSHDCSYTDWKENSGRSPGVWAFMFESGLDSKDEPSAAWKMFSTAFNIDDENDAVAERLYPEFVSDDTWNYLVTSRKILLRDDSGWIRETLTNDSSRIGIAKASRKDAVKRASKFVDPAPNKISLENWVTEVSDMEPFDQRSGEWTAFEIIRTLIEQIKGKGTDKIERYFEKLHPHNVIFTFRVAGKKCRISRRKALELV